MRTARLVMLSTAAAVVLMATARPLDGGQPLTLQVSPLMAAAPAFISVRAVVEANDDNRVLEIVAQSSDFFRSSRIDLEGRDAPPLSIVQYPNLPPGTYDVTATLIGTQGERAAATRVVRVVPRGGS